MQLDSARSAALAPEAGVGEIVVRVRSYAGAPIAQARLSYKASNDSTVVRALTDLDGTVRLRVPLAAGTLTMQVIGYGIGRLGFTPRAGYSDTVRVSTRCALVHSVPILR